MSKTVIDLDDEALDIAAKYYGTLTKKDTVNTALREVAARARRARAMEDLVEIFAAGQFDELLNKRNRR